MKRMLARSWLLGLLCVMLSAGTAQAAPCQNNLPPNNPDSVYIDHGDGTVTDTRTGLMWKQCSEGLSGATCQTGSDVGFTWANALVHAEASTFAGYSDWRLPNVRELFSLVERCRKSPSINMNLFPDNLFRSFWSGSPHLYYSDSSWSVNFNDGNAYHSGSSRSSLNRVRLVRGGQ